MSFTSTVSEGIMPFFLHHQSDRLGILAVLCNEKEELAIGKLEMQLQLEKLYWHICCMKKKPFPRNKNINSW